jgi:hypothetical protein
MNEGSSPRPKRSWRERLGLQQPAPDPDEWVTAVSTVVDDTETGFSELADSAVTALAQDGIETERRPYVIPDRGGVNWLPGFTPNASDRIRIAVLVRRRDLERARAALGPHGLLDGDGPEPR